MKRLKYLLGLFILGFGILNFGFCVDIISNLPYSNFNLDSKVYIDTYINLDDGDGNPIILYKSTYNSSNIVNFFYRWQDGKLYGYKADNYSYYKGALKGIILCDNNFENCGPTYNPLNPENFYNGSLIGTVFNKILIKDQNEVVICFGNDIGSICTYTNGSFCNSSDSCGSKGFGGAGATIESLINKIGDNIQKYSPFNVEGGGNGGDLGNLGNGGIVLGSNESAINYFEKSYGRSKNICYVGVDSVDVLYGTNGFSFEEGSGLSIFDTFEDIYGNRDLDKVYVWLNSWLFNYENWVGTNGNPSWLSRYNSGTNQVDIYYDNLTTSPFVNQPVAFWFMTTNIETKSPYTTMGADVVSYCNIKINGGSFEEIQGDAIKEAITQYTEQSNKNKGLNSDGTVVNIDFSSLMYTGDAWFSSGVDIAFSGNTTIINTLENFFGKIEGLLNDFESSSNYKLFPDWLIASFLFVILFKFLRKKK